VPDHGPALGSHGPTAITAGLRRRFLAPIQRTGEGNSRWLRRVRFCRLEANGETPMDEQTKTEIWDLAAGTFIAVSVVSGMAFIIANAIH
jgi:hypothetical protein